MNVFITGGNGFIGSHLREFLQQNYSYKIFAPTTKELNLTNKKQIDHYMAKHSIDLIIHLANKGGGCDTIGLESITEYNLRMFFNIMSHEKNVQKIISFGSGAEYGKHKPIIEAKEEDSECLMPFDEYGFYKWVTSKYIQKCDNVVQLRLFGIYGENENYCYKFITNAIVKNLLHMPIVINKNVLFDYMYVEDLLKMIDYFMHNSVREKIYNASSGKKIDLITLAKIINEVSEYSSEIILLNNGLNNEYTSDNSKILKELGVFKFTPHKEAISKLYSYFKNNFENLDTQTVRSDPYLKNINRIWKVDK